MNSAVRTSALVATSAGLSFLAACASIAPAANIPAAIAVPAGNRLAFTLKGSGLLNYECRAKADAPGTFDWVLASPDAALRDQKAALVGKYYGGPTWEHADGSKVTGRQLAIAPAPTPGSIPWQLVQATASTGSLTMNGVTYVQRINTKAGVALSDPCTAALVSSRKQVTYSADYLFYRS